MLIKSEANTGLGVMSGTSLDGLDMCIAKFEHKEYQILAAETIKYPDEIKRMLSIAHTFSSEELLIAHNSYGKYLGNQIKTFLNSSGININFIASHGHTIFHNPSKGYTFQLGSGNEIASIVQIPTIWDFRSLDIAYGGQGAPLVPIGDMLLFSEFDYCLNIGGFANISAQSESKRIAYDICPANFVLNALSESIGKPYDAYGEIAKNASADPTLLKSLNNISYYSLTPPKSLGREWVEQNIWPILSYGTLTQQCKIATFTRHIAEQIGNVLRGKDNKVLVTGGGAYNTFLIDLIKKHSECKIIIPSNEVIEFKEALLFAFLGYLRLNAKANALASVTGAKLDSSGGVISFY